MAKKYKDPVQTALFDAAPSQEELKHAVVLYQPDPARLAAVIDELLYSYTKEDLHRQAQVFAPILKNKLIVLQQPDGRRVPTTQIAPMFTMASPKEPMARALAYILSDVRNLKPYVDSLDEEMRELWKFVLLNLYCSEERAQALLGTTDELLAKSRWSYGPTGFNKCGFDFFNLTRSLSAKKVRWGYRDEQYFIRVKSYVHGLFFPLFYPDAFLDPTLNQLPDEKLRTVEFETESVAKFNLLSSLLQTGKVGMTAKGVSQADVKRTAKQLGLAEFYASDGSVCDTIRTRFYIELLALLQMQGVGGKGKKATGYPDQLRQLVDNMSKFRLHLPSLIYPHIKGLNKMMKEDNRLVALFDFMLSWLREEPERWSPVEAIFERLYAVNAGTDALQTCAMVFPPSEQKSNTEIVNEISDKEIAVDSFVYEFGFTAFQAFAFMLCSLGMAELALTTINRNSTPFDQAEYIRLTSLGRYALSLTDEYEAPEQEHVAYFELDPDRLIIRSLVDPNPYAQLLLDTSTAISRNRFETSAQSFLAHCASRSDVEEKISIFRQFVSSELPPLWREFFDSLLQHCNPLTTDKTGYTVYRLSPQNTDLIRLLTSDATLSRLVIRAEGYLILVKKEDQRKFTDELKKYGYLL